MTGLVDDEVHWAGGKAHFVQTGDLLDRGTDTRQVLDLMMRLEKEAKKAGGRVHALLGNHEVMNMLGDLRYVDPEEYEDFRTDESEQLRDEFFDRIVEPAAEGAGRKAAGRGVRRGGASGEARGGGPLGLRRAHAAPLRRTGSTGGGFASAAPWPGSTASSSSTGASARRWRPWGARRSTSRCAGRSRRTSARPARTPRRTLVAGENGPLWYRGLAKEDETLFAPALEQILEAMDARAIVVGHTVTVTGRIQDRFGGRVVMIDAGMAPAYEGSLAALEIDAEGRMTAVYPDAREVIERPRRPRSGSRRPVFAYGHGCRPRRRPLQPRTVTRREENGPPRRGGPGVLVGHRRERAGRGEAASAPAASACSACRPPPST